MAYSSQENYAVVHYCTSTSRHWSSAGLYGLTIDDIVHLDKDVSRKVAMEDKTSGEQVRLIAQLNNKEKSSLMSVVDPMLTEQKFQNFFQQNISAQ